MKCKKYTFNGDAYTATEWSKLTGIPYESIRKRLTRANEDAKKIADALTAGCSVEFLKFINPDFEIGEAINTNEIDSIPKPTINGIRIERFYGTKRVGEISLLYNGDFITIKRNLDRTVKVYCNNESVTAKPMLIELIKYFKIAVSRIEIKNTQSLGAFIFKNVNE